jgi:hypothetical protein
MPDGPILNLASTNEHVPEIERRIRVGKERCRVSRHSLPFERIPKLLTVHIFLNTVKLLSFFPTKGGILDIFSPKAILSGETLDHKKHLCLQIGQYCQVHGEDPPRNSQVPRTNGAISLGLSGNLQGGFKFMALSSGRKVVRRSCDAIPMSDTVIARVNALGSDQPTHFTFTDRHCRLIGDFDSVLPDEDPTEAPQIPGVDGAAPQIDDQQQDVPQIDDTMLTSHEWMQRKWWMQIKCNRIIPHKCLKRQRNRRRHKQT